MIITGKNRLICEDETNNNLSIAALFVANLKPFSQDTRRVCQLFNIDNAKKMLHKRLWNVIKRELSEGAAEISGASVGD